MRTKLHTGRWFEFAAAAGILLLGFQNCTQPANVQKTDDIKSLAEKSGFAYNANLDEIAYMSCYNVKPDAANGTAFFTIRAGAYRTGGLRLEDSFVNEVAKRSTQNQVDILSSSAANANTIMQLALRPKANLQSILQSGSSPVRGADYSNLLDALGSPAVSETLIRLTPYDRIRRMRNGAAEGARFEGDLSFSENYTTEASIRTSLQGVSGSTAAPPSVLALTFSNGGAGVSDAVSARGPATLDTKSSLAIGRYVFGRGYSLGFGLPNVTPVYSQFPSNVMTRVSESNLAEPTDTTAAGEWVCPANMQFKIIRPGDEMVAGARCAKAPDPEKPDATLLMVRNVLRVEDWYVDLANRCIVQKVHGSGCYGDYQNIVYNNGDSCRTIPLVGGSTTEPMCAAFTSICYRKN